jgi:hypothetical protein
MITNITENNWLSGLCPSSRILNTRKQDVSENGSVSVLRIGEGYILFNPLERAILNYWSTA